MSTTWWLRSREVQIGQASKKFARCGDDHTEDGVGEKTIDMNGIRAWIEAEGSGHWFFIAFPVCLLALLIWFKGRRVRFLIPSLLITVVIINPVFYRLWDELGLYAYWRILWIVPVIPVVASIVPMITEKIQKPWMKAAMAVTGVGVVLLGGTFLYSGSGGAFVRAANAAKLSDDVVKIADRLLEMEERPRIIAQDPIGVYIRQYTGEIDSLFGRDIYGIYITPPDYETIVVYNQLNAGDMKPVSQYMIDESHNFLVYKGDVGSDFKLVDSIADYGIYKPLGNPKVIKERNELGQEVSITTVNENRNPVENAYGYATVHRDYDNAGNIIEEYKTDTNGECVEQAGGYYKIRQKFDTRGHLISRTYLDINNEPVVRTDGYTAVEWHTDSRGTRNVSFYDAAGNELPIEGVNLVRDIEIGADGWSEWMSPEYNAEDIVFYIGVANLDMREAGDLYTSQLEIEFSGVTSTEGKKFRFYAQGSTDGVWNIGNIWDGALIWFGEPPKDWTYKAVRTYEMTDKLAQINNFSLGFRCDNWASGSFRVRNVKIEKGDTPSEWSPGF